MNNTRVLVIDDEALVRDVLAHVLSVLGGHEVDVSCNGAEGLKKLQDNRYDLVFADLYMPRVDGIEFLKRAHQIDPTLPVVIITGLATVDDAIEAMKNGASEFLQKPFDTKSVLELTEKLLARRKLLDKLSANGGGVDNINTELSRGLEELSLFRALSGEFDDIYDNEDLYQKIVETSSKLLSVRDVAFGVVDGRQLKIKCAVGCKVKSDVPVEKTYLEKVLKTKRHLIVGKGETNVFTGRPLEGPLLVIPLVIHNDTFGMLAIGNKTDGTELVEEEISLAIALANRVVLRIENNALYDSIYNNLLNTLRSLVYIIEARDPYTKQHSERVTSYAIEIARTMGLGNEELEILKFGGYLHDIGKIGVRDTILLKPGKLTPDEWRQVQMHPVIGNNIVQPIRFLDSEREIILHHHERYDGNGYPHGLKAEEIPPLARILSVADAYDAMTSSRAYRPAKSHASSVEEIRQCAGSQFDPDVVVAFMETLASLRKAGPE